MKVVAVSTLLLAAGLACQSVADPGEFATIERGPLSVTVEVSGVMRAVDADRLTPPPVPGMWNYKISMMAPEGATVEEGDPVLGLDTGDLQRLLAEKVAERDSAATQLEVKLAAARVARHDERLAIAEAEAELRKATIKAEAPPDITPVIDLEKARRDLLLAKEKIAYLERKSRSAAKRDDAECSRWKSKRDRAEQRVGEMQAAIENMTVKAPRAGTVIYHTDWEGQKKKIGDSAWRAETVMQVASLAEMEGDGQIDEVDISRVRIDQPVLLRLDAQADLAVHGRVRSISHTVQHASPDNPLKVARLVVAIEPGEHARLRPGMRFRGEIEIERFEDVLLAPADAVLPTADGPIARRRSGHAVETVPVGVGARNARWVAIDDGLAEGDEVLRIEETEP